MNKYILIGIIALFAAQLYVPADMIMKKEHILVKGKMYKFKTAPIDPVDPLRGKYVYLRFDENRIEVDTNLTWSKGQKIYLELIEDKKGFAKIKDVFQKEPEDLDNILISSVDYVIYNGKSIRIDYPFERFYMEESKAYPAEVLYRSFNRNSNMDSTQVAYASISILNGEAVLKNVFINEVPLKEVVENYLDTLSVK